MSGLFIWNPSLLWWSRVLSLTLFFLILILVVITKSPWWLISLLLVLLVFFVLISIVGHFSERQHWNFAKTTMTAKPITEFTTFVINMDNRPDRWAVMERELKSQGMTATRWSGVNGKETSDAQLREIGIGQSLIDKNRSAAGCAASHISLWKHILKNKLGWCLILEDDATFHPNFSEIFPQYWSEVPTDADIVYAGYLDILDWIKPSKSKIFPHGVVCNHAYLISHTGAEELLKLLPIKQDFDIELATHYNWSPKSICFNDVCQVTLLDGRKIFPCEYRNTHDVVFHGLIYQNWAELGSDIRTMFVGKK